MGLCLLHTAAFDGGTWHTQFFWRRGFGPRNSRRLTYGREVAQSRFSRQCHFSWDYTALLGRAAK